MDLRQAIWDYLQLQKKPTPRRELLKHLHGLGFEVRDEDMRKEKKEMVFAGYLIGSTHNLKWPGYFVIRNMAQAEIAALEHRQKAHSELEQANILLRNAARAFVPDKQVKLFEIAERKVFI